MPSSSYACINQLHIHLNLHRYSVADASGASASASVRIVIEQRARLTLPPLTFDVTKPGGQAVAQKDAESAATWLSSNRQAALQVAAASLRRLLRPGLEQLGVARDAQVRSATATAPSQSTGSNKTATWQVTLNLDLVVAVPLSSVLSALGLSISSNSGDQARRRLLESYVDDDLTESTLTWAKALTSQCSASGPTDSTAMPLSFPSSSGSANLLTLEVPSQGISLKLSDAGNTAQAGSGAEPTPAALTCASRRLSDQDVMVSGLVSSLAQASSGISTLATRLQAVPSMLQDLADKLAVQDSRIALLVRAQVASCTGEGGGCSALWGCVVLWCWTEAGDGACQ